LTARPPQRARSRTVPSRHTTGDIFRPAAIRKWAGTMVVSALVRTIATALPWHALQTWINPSPIGPNSGTGYQSPHPSHCSRTLPGLWRHLLPASAPAVVQELWPRLQGLRMFRLVVKLGRVPFQHCKSLSSGLLVKGAYTSSKAIGMADDDRSAGSDFRNARQMTKADLIELSKCIGKTARRSHRSQKRRADHPHWKERCCAHRCAARGGVSRGTDLRSRVDSDNRTGKASQGDLEMERHVAYCPGAVLRFCRRGSLFALKALLRSPSPPDRVPEWKMQGLPIARASRAYAGLTPTSQNIDHRRAAARWLCQKNHPGRHRQ
jgi:hypothetical protein